MFFWPFTTTRTTHRLAPEGSDQVKPTAVAVPPSAQLLGQLPGRGQIGYHISYHSTERHQRNRKNSSANSQGRYTQKNMQ
jgi:hypothetical protein